MEPFISRDGALLYFVDGVFSGNPYPDVSNFVYAVDAGSGFVEAPTLSDDERDLYYHRLNTDSGKFELVRVRRP